MCVRICVGVGVWVCAHGCVCEKVREVSKAVLYAYLFQGRKVGRRNELVSKTSTFNYNSLGIRSLTIQHHFHQLIRPIISCYLQNHKQQTMEQ